VPTHFYKKTGKEEGKENVKKNNRGFVKLYRNIMDAPFYKEPDFMLVYLHLLFKANIKDSVYKNKVIKRGQYVGGRRRIIEELGMSQYKVRKILSTLEDLKYIARHFGRNIPIITMTYYDDQPKDQPKDQPHYYNIIKNNIKKVVENRAFESAISTPHKKKDIRHPIDVWKEDVLLKEEERGDENEDE
jgi:hypothetical protein